MNKCANGTTSSVVGSISLRSKIVVSFAVYLASDIAASGKPRGPGQSNLAHKSLPAPPHLVTRPGPRGLCVGNGLKNDWRGE
jgi:hypothetical protein